MFTHRYETHVGIAGLVPHLASSSVKLVNCWLTAHLVKWMQMSKSQKVKNPAIVSQEFNHGLNCCFIIYLLCVHSQIVVKLNYQFRFSPGCPTVYIPLTICDYLVLGGLKANFLDLSTLHTVLFLYQTMPSKKERTSIILIP